MVLGIGVRAPAPELPLSRFPDARTVGLSWNRRRRHGRTNVVIERRLTAIVLAAGEGTRMRSTRPKPLHLLCGRTMVRYVLDALSESNVSKAVVVVGHGAELVTKKLQDEAGDLNLDFVEQYVQRGTGDAVSVGLTGFVDEDDEGDILVLPGDTPLLRSSTVATLVREHQLSGAACSILTAHSDDATGYGRIVRGKDDDVVRVVEERDATEEERAITEWNTSIYCFRRSVLAPALRRVTPDNEQGEYYLTDVVAVLHDAGYPIVAVPTDDDDEAQGVNDRAPARTGRGRASPAHERPVARPRRHDARPRAHVHRRQRQPRPRRDALPWHAAARTHGHRRRRRDRSEHPPGRLHRRALAASSRRPSAVTPTSAPARSSGLLRFSTLAHPYRRAREPARSTLRLRRMGARSS